MASPRVWGRLTSLNPRHLHVDLTKDTTLLGRHHNCDVAYTDSRISSRHCRVVRDRDDGGRSFVEDLSTNGTFVNGDRINKGCRREIVSGDELSLVIASAAHADPSFQQTFVAYLFQAVCPSSPTTEEGGGACVVLRRTSTATNPGKIEDFYEVAGLLGTGGFSVVKLGIHRATGEKVAVKIIDKERLLLRRDRVMREVQVMKVLQLHHPNIVSLREVFEGPRFLYIVMEYVSGGELFDRIITSKFFSESDACRLVTQVLGAVQYLHSQNVVHRDLKPENILMADTSPDAPIKLTDFGLSKVLGEDQFLMKTFVGTLQYLAPEVLSIKNVQKGISPTTKGYSKACDLWSIGVVAYILLCGYPPFNAENSRELCEQIQEGRFDFEGPKWFNVSGEAKNFVQRLLTVDPDRRMTVEEAQQHPWVRQENPPSIALSLSNHLQTEKEKGSFRVGEGFPCESAIRHLSSLLMENQSSEGTHPDKEQQSKRKAPMDSGDMLNGERRGKKG